MTKDADSEWLRKRLDVIIQLLLESGPAGAKSVTDKIGRLLAMGLTHTETAQVVGKPTKYVWAISGRTQKKGGTARGKRKKDAPETISAEADAAQEAS